MSPKRIIYLISGSMLLAALLLVSSFKPVQKVDEGSQSSSKEVMLPYQTLTTTSMSNLHVSVSLNRKQMNLLQELNSNFMLKYPHIKVKIENTMLSSNEDEVHNAWLELGKKRMNADVMLLGNSWVKSFAVRGYLKPADRVSAVDTQTDQLETLLDPLKWNGYMWAAPAFANPYIVVWNEALLQKAGLTEAPADWQAFTLAADQLLAVDNQVKLVNLADDDLQQLFVWLESLQALSPNLLHTLDFPEGELVHTEQMEWLQAMEEYIGRRAKTNSWSLYDDLQSDRTLAAIVSWEMYEGMESGLRRKLIVNKEYIYYPWLNGGSFAISSNTKHEEEAAIWIKEMTSTHAQLELYKQLGLLPTRYSLYSSSSDVFSTASAPPAWSAAALSKKREQVRSGEAAPDWPAAWSELEKRWSIIMNEKDF